MDKKKPENNIIYGFRAVSEALKANKKIEKVLFKKNLQTPQFKEIFKIVRDKKINFQFVPEQKLNKIIPNNQGIIAFSQLIEYVNPISTIKKIIQQNQTPFIIILDGITDVRNLGSIARTAECAGVNLIILKQKNSAIINSEAIKASAGALAHIPVSRVENLPSLIEELKKLNIKIIAATEKAENTIYETPLNQPVAIILGDEFKGISYPLLKLADFKAKIPLQGKTNSLNVSNAASVIIFEVVRQRFFL